MNQPFDLELELEEVCCSNCDMLLGASLTPIDHHVFCSKACEDQFNELTEKYGKESK